MIVAGISAGLTQAPLFAAAGTLPPDRATTGSAVLNMARQVGSAVGVAVVVVILGTGAAHTVAGFHHVWAAEADRGPDRLPGHRGHGTPVTGQSSPAAGRGPGDSALVSNPTRWPGPSRTARPRR